MGLEKSIRLPTHTDTARFTKVGFGDHLLRPFFEGPVDVKFFDDAIEIKGKCFNCHGVIEGVLRIPPQLRDLDKTHEGRQEIVNIACDQVCNRHQCSQLFEGRRDVDDWLKAVAREARH